MNNPATLSIIIPILHEKNLDSFIANLERLPEIDSCEIIIVDGGDSAVNLTEISPLHIRTLSTSAGRGHQMDIGARHAHGDILLFLHADTILPLHAIPLILYTMSDPWISAGAFSLAINSPDPRFRLLAALTTLRSRLTRIPFGDQAIFIRKTVFDSLGGYRGIPIMEDVDLMLRLRLTDHRIKILPELVLTSARRWHHDGLLLGTIRNWILRTLYYLGVPPKTLQGWYRH